MEARKGSQSHRDKKKNIGSEKLEKSANREVLGETIMKYVMSHLPATFSPFSSHENLFIWGLDKAAVEDIWKC